MSFTIGYGSTTDNSILECIGKSNLSWCHLLGSEVGLSGRCGKASRVSSLGSTIVSSLLSSPSTRDNVKLVVTLTYAAINQNTTSGILSIEIAILLTTYYQVTSKGASSAIGKSIKLSYSSYSSRTRLFYKLFSCN